MKVVAFGHKSRQGKDSAAKFLFSELKCRAPKLVVKRVGFADKVKEIAHDLYGHLGLHCKAYYEQEANEGLRYIPLAKINKSPVDIWIELGNKVREIYNDSWVEYVTDGIKCDVLIISDLRFENEANSVHQAGGSCIKIVRPGFPGLASVSDNALNDYTGWDRVIEATDLGELHAKVVVIADEVLSDG